MKKQLMAGMMAASMALSLAACGGSAASSAAPAADSTSGAASTSTAASTSSDEQVTLRFAWWGGDERANATMEVINKFMEENPNIKIEAEYGSSDGYHDKLATQLASGTAADIVQVDPETMPTFVATGDYFLDYNDYGFDLSNFEESYISQRVNASQLGHHHPALRSVQQVRLGRFLHAILGARPAGLLPILHLSAHPVHARHPPRSGRIRLH